jgi:catechol 2,3-dioxygenase-like lactoylglutathione lyase family enzyme
MQPVEIEQIDHVHVHVRDRDAAARWFADVLGLRRDARFASWAEDPDGPLMLATASGDTRVALFRDHGAEQPGARARTLAFRIGAAGFLAFAGRLPDSRIGADLGRPLAPGDVVDHELAWSFYFRDPDGNRIELTTYDYDEVARALGRVEAVKGAER